MSDTGSSFGGYNFGGRNAASRFDDSNPFAFSHETPGAKRARAQGEKHHPASPKTIDGELTASPQKPQYSSGFSLGQKVLHLKFGEGEVLAIEGTKLTIHFATVGRKKVLESFVKGG